MSLSYTPPNWLQDIAFAPPISPPPTPKNLYEVKVDDIKTQKARGYRLLYAVSGSDGPDLSYTYLLPQNLPWLKNHPSAINPDMFARPCPVTPRHGFVESRSVCDLDEAIAVWDEAKREDPNAELLLADRLTGRYSGIATNIGVTWGMGNDGVTGSKGTTFTIPTPAADVEKWNSIYITNFYYNTGISGVGYIEIVEHEGRTKLVQFRDGPQLPTTQDFIPRKTKVTEVLWEESDLLAWERKLKEKKNRAGLVVQLKKGTALSSHAAVHAIALGIPAVNSHHVQVGDTLSPSIDRPRKLTKTDYALLREMFQRNEKKQPSKNRTKLLTAAATIHSMSAWDNSPHLMRLRAFAIPTIIRFMAAACYGEMRHWEGNGPGGNNGDVYTTLFTVNTRAWDDDGERELTELSREYVYEHAFDFSFATIREGFKTMIVDFSNPNWRNRKKPPVGLSREGLRRWRKAYSRKGFAYGGPKWAEVAKAGLALLEAYTRFTRIPSTATWADVIISSNNAIHTAHNGGFALSKWLSDDDFHRIAIAPAVGFMNPKAATLTLDLGGE